MQVQEYNTFPTKVLQIDVSDVITTSDTSDMILTIDDLINNYPDSLSDSSTVQTQSKTILFDNEAPACFQKLKKTFLKSCEIYLQEYEHDYINTHSRAWFFKSSKSSSTPISWHDHYPSLLSGVFSIKSQGIGTIFKNPVSFSLDKSPIVIEPKDLSWIIFPSSLVHSNDNITSNNDRYVVAADYFVATN